jgi:S-DNA-T family DNA segregation ATPase FtsK/SpoIIIE
MPFSLFVPRRPEPVPNVAAATGAAAADRGARKLVHGYAREAAALVLLATALYAALALASVRGDPMRPEIVGDDWVGPVGSMVAQAAVAAVGLAAWLLPVELSLLAAPLLNGQRSRASVVRLAGDVVVVVVLAALGHVALPAATAFGAMPLGGAVGELFGEIMRALFSTIGSYIVGLTIVALILIGRATFSFIEWTQRTRRAAAKLGERSAGGISAIAGAWAAARELDKQRKDDERREAEPFIASPTSADAIIAALADDPAEGAALEDSGSAWERPSDPALLAREASASAEPVTPSPVAKRALPEVTSDDVPTPEPSPARRARRASKDKDKDKPAADEKPTPRGAPEVKAAPVVETTVATEAAGFTIAKSVEATTVDVTDEAEDVLTPSPILPVSAPEPEAARKPAPKPRQPKIVDTSAAAVTEKAEIVHVVPAHGEGFRLPSPDLLDAAPPARVVLDETQLKETAQLLEKTLADYGVSGKVEEIHPGPTVTTFEVSPAAGTKVSKVASLADDLALGLSRKVRIIAPIPGKNRIGFEIPNPERSPVNLRELIEDRRFVEMKAPLPCVLGRDIIGAPYFADLASMPHVIVAGATGAGKSVGLNVMLVSLLSRRTPAELRLLMIDPKVVELAPFDKIPHMLLPVVTDMKQAANALKWAVDEMERRYQLFANAGTKNITTYNGWVERVHRGEARPPKPPAKVAAVGFDGTEVEVDAAKDGSDAELPEKLPYIVIVVDEFADLMMQQGKDVEASVARLAQKARAAGMHVILATQRPSVDVITGMIKANFPTRIAFRVAQKVDSRTILDEQGAEHLLGKGDMLVKMNGSNDTRRVQCPFCSEEEVQRVNDFLRLQGEPVYDEAILKPREEDGEAADTSDVESDPMYDAAVRIVADTRRCSTSWIQRKLGIGYNRAAKLVEAMEKRGLVGPANGAKDREVLISPI